VGSYSGTACFVRQSVSHRGRGTVTLRRAGLSTTGDACPRWEAAECLSPRRDRAVRGGPVQVGRHIPSWPGNSHRSLSDNRGACADGNAGPRAQRATQRVAPTTLGGSSVRVPPGQGSVGRPGSEGVRRCLTRRPVRAGNADVGRWSRCRWDRGRSRCTPGESAAPMARWARQRLAPTRGGRCVAGAALVRHGLAPPSPSCRGQAVPDPPARRVGRPTPMVAAVRLPIPVRTVGHDA
jgi:hypothetical protein